jgi:hypothetical protein
MESTKEIFIESVNRKGVLFVRERNPDDDATGWKAFEFVLNDGTVFLVSNFPFGQGKGEDGIWIDMNSYSEIYFEKLRQRLKQGIF